MRCPTCRRGFTSRCVLPNFALRALLRDQEQAAGTGQISHHGEVMQEGGTMASQVGPGASVPDLSWVQQVARDPSGGQQLQNLIDSGVPAGLARLILEEDRQIALRIFLLDNSGSTSHPDGQYLEPAPSNGGKPGMMCLRQCTRWEEIVHLSMEQAKWNLLLGTPCEFVLLNPLARGEQLEPGVDYQRIDTALSACESQLEALRSMLSLTGPRGVTPLTDRLKKIRARLRPEAPELARRGQRVVLVLATDGLPTSTRSAQSGDSERRELVRELRTLSLELPMHIVVRLCTNDDSVAAFYNDLDGEEELELEVIDDMVGEARELRKVGNRWITYSPLVHRMREGGTLMKLFDLLDERRLTPLEVCMLCQLLAREAVDDTPLPGDAVELMRALRERLPHLSLVYDPLRSCMMPPVLVDEVARALLPGGRLRRACGALASSRHLLAVGVAAALFLGMCWANAPDQPSEI